MSVYTCYTALTSTWCGMVPIETWIDTLATATTIVGENNPTPTNDWDTQGEDVKGSQTDDKGQPEETWQAEPWETSSSIEYRHTITLLTIISTTGTVASPGPTSVDAVETAAAASGGGGAGGSGGVSKGAAACIAIGTAILGGLIAFLAAFMLFGRRRRSSGHGYSDSTTNFIQTMNSAPPSYMEVPLTGPPPILAAAIIPSNRTLDLTDLSRSSGFLAGVLPPAADQETIKRKVTALFNQILQHVDGFYRDIHTTLTPSMEKELKGFGSASMDLAEELRLSSMPTTTIKHALVSYILSIVAPEAEQQDTLFPAEVVGLRENERSVESPDDQAVYILYKRLAVHLHAPAASALRSPQSDVREVAEHIALTFFPWANPTYADQDKDDNLVAVINNALDLSLWLFGQPYVYDWVWEDAGSRGTVIAPGLVRVTDETGQRIEGERIVEGVLVMDD